MKTNAEVLQSNAYFFFQTEVKSVVESLKNISGLTIQEVTLAESSLITGAKLMLFIRF